MLNGKYVQEYSEKSVSILREYIKALKRAHYLLFKNLTQPKCSDCRKDRENRIEDIWRKLEGDPEKGLAELKQLRDEFKAKSERGSKKCKRCRKNFLVKGIIPSLKIISKTKIMRKIESERGQKPLEKIFNPTSRPNFLQSKIKLSPPPKAELADAYKIDENKVRIYYSSKKLEYLYFLIPPEYRLPPRQVKP